MWKCRKSQILAIFEKVDFWRFWASRTTRNNGDIQFSVAKSCLTQVFRPGCQFSAQSLNCIHIFEAPQKCDFRGSRHVCVKNGQNSGGRARTPWVVEIDSDHRVMTKTVKNLFGTLFGIFWWVFRAKINFDSFPFLRSQYRILAQGRNFQVRPNVTENVWNCPKLVRWRF